MVFPFNPFVAQFSHFSHFPPSENSQSSLFFLPPPPPPVALSPLFSAQPTPHPLSQGEGGREGYVAHFGFCYSRLSLQQRQSRRNQPKQCWMSNSQSTFLALSWLSAPFSSTDCCTLTFKIVALVAPCFCCCGSFTGMKTGSVFSRLLSRHYLPCMIWSLLYPKRGTIAELYHYR